MSDHLFTGKDGWSPFVYGVDIDPEQRAQVRSDGAATGEQKYKLS